MRRPIILIAISGHSNDSLFSGDVGMHYSRGRKRDARERGAKGSEEREEQEKERGKRAGRSHRMVYHATPRCADVGCRGLNARRAWDEEKENY